MRRFLKSLTHALRGILYTVRNERNFQVEVAATVFLLGCMVWLPLSRAEESMLILAAVLVLVMELVNTAVERVMDILKPRVHPYARVVKDVTAGGVFVASLGALSVGLLILLPYFMK